jgi:hypothetical protein
VGQESPGGSSDRRRYLDLGRRAERRAAPPEATSPIASAKPPPASEDEQPSAEVAAVDFGSRAGAVYYVSGDNTGSNGQSMTTTVVWLTDE